MFEKNSFISPLLMFIIYALYEAFDSRTRSARELMRQVHADRFTKSNPKLKINTMVVGTTEPPQVEFEFIDGKVMTYDSQQYQAKEMLDEIFLTANNMDIEFELGGKSVDDK